MGQVFCVQALFLALEICELAGDLLVLVSLFIHELAHRLQIKLILLSDKLKGFVSRVVRNEFQFSLQKNERARNDQLDRPRALARNQVLQNEAKVVFLISRSPFLLFLRLSGQINIAFALSRENRCHCVGAFHLLALHYFVANVVQKLILH